MMGKMGYDIVVSKLDEKELAFSQDALKTYSRVKEVIWKGDLFRLVSPQTSDMASLLYVSEKQDKAVWFNYLGRKPLSGRQPGSDSVERFASGEEVPDSGSERISGHQFTDQ